MWDEVLELAARLKDRREPFALATVVARDRPQSVTTGARAVVRSDGSIRGWIGGGCVRPAVVDEALQALRDGRPRLLRIGLEPESDPPPGVRIYPMTCHGGGRVEVYVEPMLPMPRLVVFGATPVAQALAALAGALDFDVSVVDERAEESRFPGIERMDPTTGDPSTLLGPDSFVVVATQGDGDEEALRASLAGESAYLGLVASRKKGRTILDFLEAQGMSTDRLGTVRYPAGLDLGGMTPPEIALSVLAEIVAVRAGKAKEDVAVNVLGGPSAASPGLPIHPAHHGAPQATHGSPGTPAASHDTAAGTAIDPVCGMTVKIEGARYRSEHDGEAFYFCCPMCQAAFDKDPSAYGGATTG